MTDVSPSGQPGTNVPGSEDDFSGNGVGIVHFGVGAFHRAHQASFIHDVLKLHGGDWRILGVNLQSTEPADQLNAQNGEYTLSVRQNGRLQTRLIKSIAQALAASRDPGEVLEVLGSPNTRILSMTVTEKAYGIDREKGVVNTDNPTVAHDLEHPDHPRGIIGYLVKGLGLRKAAGLKPFTVLCCDNLPQNGELVRTGVIDFARRIASNELAEWIEAEVTFPSTMVDRITPAVSASLTEEVQSQCGISERMPVETEPFSQWVIEDSFCNGRPQLEDVGVLFVDQVEPYERMKLRMLNGTHSLISYLGFLAGFPFVRDVMADKDLHVLAERHLSAAAQTLGTLEGIDFADYARELLNRFANPEIAHATYQIAMDGSQKMPQRIFEPALDALRAGKSIAPFALATAAWMRYCSGKHEDGAPYELNDPRAEELTRAFENGDLAATRIVDNFCSLPDLMPTELSASPVWKNAVVNLLDGMITDGVHQVIATVQTEQ